MTGLLITAWAHVTSSLAIQVFAVSFLALAAGMCVEIRRKAITFSFLDRIPLSHIERTHPHLPSLEVVLTVLFCYSTLIAAAMTLLGGLAPFNGPYQWLQFMSVLFLIATGSVIGILQRRRAYGYVFGLLIGSAMPLLVIASKFMVQGKISMGVGAAVIGLVLMSGFLSWISVERHASEPPYLLVIGTAFVWLLPFIFLV